MNLRIITGAEKAANAASAWKAQYFTGGKWGPMGKEDSEKIYNGIKEANGDPEKVAKAIGNKSWSHLRCDVCDEYKDVAIQVGEYDQKIVCHTCLCAAKGALEAVTEALARSLNITAGVTK